MRVRQLDTIMEGMAKLFFRLPARRRSPPALLPLLLALSLLAPTALLHAQAPGAQADLSISPGDLLIELREDGGFHLFIRHRPDISSVLLTETTRDPLFREPNFAYRAPEWNPINGDEIRILDGYIISPEEALHSLVSSTPRWHPSLGWAFHIYIPYRVLYGHEGGRQGEVFIADGMYLNIRAFYYAHADYRGPFMDNPFTLVVAQELALPPPPPALPPPGLPPPPPAPPGRRFLPSAAEAFAALAGAGNTSFAARPADMTERLRDVLELAQGSELDIVLCIDATGSMGPFITEIRTQLVPELHRAVGSFESVRVGMVFFRDHGDDFLYKIVPFTSDFDQLQREIDGMSARGGGDIPEAVYEALFAGATGLDWQSERRIMVLIGDAPPHSTPRGMITRDMVQREIARQGIDLHAIILPHP